MISRRRLLAGLPLVPALLGQVAPTADDIYDVLLKDGQLIDLKNNRTGRLDIGIVGNRIVRIATGLPAAHAQRVVEVGDYYVTPGLIDINTHFDLDAVGISLKPDHHMLTNGVTTAVDAGSWGHKNFEDFKARTIDRARCRILAWLHIVGTGMNGPAVEQGASQMDAKASAALVKKYSEVIVGVKTAHLRGGAWDSVDRAVEAGELSGTPVMVEFNPTPERSYADLLSDHMRPGDIQTQLYSRRSPLLGGDNKIADYVVAARNRGVLFDVGHGSDGFWFRSAIPAVQQGFLPDTISTDINKSSIMLPRANMTTTMSKFLNMGLSFEQVIERSTVRPAQAIRRPELGQLSEGGIADIAVFKVETGQFGFVDSGQSKMMGDRRIRCVLTIRNGRIVWDTEGLSLTDWQAVGRYSNYR